MFPFKLSSTEISPDYFYTYNVLRRVYHRSDHLSLWNLLTMDCQCWELLIFPDDFTVVTDNCFWYWSPLSFTPCGVQGSNKIPPPLPIYPGPASLLKPGLLHGFKLVPTVLLYDVLGLTLFRLPSGIQCRTVLVEWG